MTLREERDLPCSSESTFGLAIDVGRYEKACESCSVNNEALLSPGLRPGIVRFGPLTSAVKSFEDCESVLDLSGNARDWLPVNEELKERERAI